MEILFRVPHKESHLTQYDDFFKSRYYTKLFKLFNGRKETRGIQEHYKGSSKLPDLEYCLYRYNTSGNKSYNAYRTIPYPEKLKEMIYEKIIDSSSNDYTFISSHEYLHSISNFFKEYKDLYEEGIYVIPLHSDVVLSHKNCTDSKYLANNNSYWKGIDDNGIQLFYKDSSIGWVYERPKYVMVLNTKRFILCNLCMTQHSEYLLSINYTTDSYGRIVQELLRNVYINSIFFDTVISLMDILTTALYFTNYYVPVITGKVVCKKILFEYKYTYFIKSIDTFIKILRDYNGSLIQPNVQRDALEYDINFYLYLLYIVRNVDIDIKTKSLSVPVDKFSDKDKLNELQKGLEGLNKLLLNEHSETSRINLCLLAMHARKTDYNGYVSNYRELKEEILWA